MIEIDHSALPEPAPAIPVLASHLLAIEKKQRARFGTNGGRIKTGCTEIDDYVLGGGGFARGVVLGLSGEDDEGRLLSLNLLTTVLLSHLSESPSISRDLTSSGLKHRALVIDTNGSFDIRLLAKIIKFRILTNQQSYNRRNVSSGNYGSIQLKKATEESMVEVDQQVELCLEMVAISRVFNIEGLWEVLGELGRSTIQNPGLNVAEPGLDARKENLVYIPEPENDRREKELEVGDSEDSSPGSISDLLPRSEEGTVLQNALPDKRAKSNAEEGIELIIVDNMTHIINELFSRKEKGEAHNLLKTLSRTLHTLSSGSDILTILHNGTASTKPSFSSNYDKQDRRQSQQHQAPFKSVFSSNPVKPALGRIFDQFTSLHVLLSSIPRSREDAEMLYGQEDGVVSNLSIIKYCTIVEVLKDETPNLGERSEGMRFGAMEQRWAAVIVSNDGCTLVPAFMEKGTMKGLGHSRGVVQDVGSVAKIYGFGGRRI